MTIDGLAVHLTQRWRSLCSHLNIAPGDFESTCDAAGRLLEEAVVGQWIAATYPIVVVDEAQELSPGRLRMIKALAAHVSLIIAADEFQCLNENTDTAPFMEWLQTGRIERLSTIHRTSQSGLLAAAASLRRGASPQDNGRDFRIRYEYPNQAKFAIGHALHAAIGQRGSIAVIVAPGGKQWMDSLLPSFQEGFRSKKQVIRPLRIDWEERPEEEIRRVTAALDRIQLAEPEIVDALSGLLSPPPWASSVLDTVRYQRRVCNKIAWTREEFNDLIERKAQYHRSYAIGRRDRSIPVMTIHGAKNRQFRHVIVLWPHGVRGDADQQARLLYNAITRAEASCTIFVRGRELLSAPPFQFPGAH
jgi:hypothetical protein